MREAAHLSRRAAAALPLAALIRPVAAAVPAMPAAAGDDAELLDIGRRWLVALAAEQAHERAFDTSMRDDEAQQHEAIGDELHEASNALLEQIIRVQAATPAGLAIKAKVLAYETEAVENLDEASIASAIAAAHYTLDRAALSLALDILRLGGGDA